MKGSLRLVAFVMAIGCVVSTQRAEAYFPDYCYNDYRGCLASGIDPDMCREYFNICRFGNQSRAVDEAVAMRRRP